MRKLNSKKKLIGAIAIILVAVILAIVITTNIVNNRQIANEGYSATTANAGSSLISNYILNGITIGGITGKMDILNTNDATATAEDIAWGKTAYVKGKKVTGTYLTLEMLNIGDYVNYEPDVSNDYSIEAIYSGYSSDQLIKQEDFSWRILSKNSNGTVNLISNVETKQKIIISNAVGYNNGVYLLNDISAKQYSNARLGAKARNLNVEDIEKELTDEGKKYIYSCENAYSDLNLKLGEKYTYTTNLSYPMIYSMENNSGIDTETVKKDGINQSESYYNSLTSETFSQANLLLTVTQTFYNSPMNKDLYQNEKFYSLIHNGGEYWLASRFSNINQDYASFGIRIVDNNYIGGNNLFYSSTGVDIRLNNSLRPVVTLDANIRLLSGDGKTPETAYQLENR